MADIGEQLIVYLKTQSGVTTLCGTGSSARILQQDGMRESGTMPAVCVTVTNDDAVGYLGGDSALRRADVSLVGFGESVSARNSLAAALDAAMAAVTTSVGTIPVGEVSTLAGRSDGDILAQDGSDQRIYMTTFAYRIWHY